MLRSLCGLNCYDRYARAVGQWVKWVIFSMGHMGHSTQFCTVVYRLLF